MSDKYPASKRIRLQVVPEGASYCEYSDFDLEPDVILDNLKGKLNGFVLVGYCSDGKEFFSSTYADGAEALWLLERAKKALLEIVP